MNAHQLYKKDGSPVEVFYCGKCGVVSRTQEEADGCCLCSICKTSGRMANSSYCKKCDDDRFEQMKRKSDECDQHILDTADVTEEWEYVWYNDQMYSELDELIEDCEGNPPKFVHAMKPRYFDGFDFDDIIENKSECIEFDDDNDLRDVLVGLDQLKEVIEVVNKLNSGKIVWWSVDKKRKVRVQKGGE